MERNEMTHIAICDDEKDFVAHLTGLLNQYAAETGEEIKVTAYYDGMELIEKYDTAMPPIIPMNSAKITTNITPKAPAKILGAK